MEMTRDDCLKKALLDTQERIRDFMNYSNKFEDDNLREYFREYARLEGEQAHKLQGFIKQSQPM